MKNEIEQKQNLERRNEMLLEEYGVYLNSNDTEPTTYTWANSLEKAMANILSPDQKKIIANAGRIIIDLDDVKNEKLIFKKTGRTASVATKKIVRPKITEQKFYWEKENDITEEELAALRS